MVKSNKATINDFPWITPYTPVIPKLYWDVYSQEERLKWLALEYDRVFHYLSDVAKYINDNDGKFQATVDEINERTKTLETIVDNLVEQLSNITANLPTYDPTQGLYVSSQTSHRNLFRELAVFGARANQMATLTAEEAANTSCLEMAVIGNKTVFGNPEPRVTPQR